jgi:hypothetical protein
LQLPLKIFCTWCLLPFKTFWNISLKCSIKNFKAKHFQWVPGPATQWKNFGLRNERTRVLLPTKAHNFRAWRRLMVKYMLDVRWHLTERRCNSTVAKGTHNSEQIGPINNSGGWTPDKGGSDQQVNQRYDQDPFYHQIW